MSTLPLPENVRYPVATFGCPDRALLEFESARYVAHRLATIQVRDFASKHR